MPSWILTTVLVAYSFGANGIRHQISMYSLPLAIIVVPGVILDIGRPRRGLIRLSRQPMIELQNQIRTAESLRQAAIYSKEEKTFPQLPARVSTLSH